MRLATNCCWCIFLIATVALFRAETRSLRKRSITDADPCLDKELIDNPELVTFSHQFQNVSRPWIRNDDVNVKLYRSVGINYRWAWMKSLCVKGIRRQCSIEDIVQFMANKNCLFMPYGPTVRTFILRDDTTWLKGEVSCDISELYTHCVEKYGETLCSLYPIEDGGWGEYRLEIGDGSVNNTIGEVRAEPISIYNWGTFTKKKPESWAYTVEDMALYDDLSGSTILVDITGNGFTDTCEKRLVPTVRDDEWEEWSEKQPLKILRFYDLRADGFSVSNSNFQRFINKKITEGFDRKAAETFYCENILKGVIDYNDETTICYTIYPESESARHIATIRTIMTKELGLSWNETIGKAVDQLEAVYLTNKQFADIKAKLKHRILSEESLKTTTELPKIIVEGKPMIKDMEEVHKRPILTMANGPVVELPKEFPSAPKAKPNENLEFEEASATQLDDKKEPFAYLTSSEDSDERTKFGVLNPKTRMIEVTNPDVWNQESVVHSDEDLSEKDRKAAAITTIKSKDDYEPKDYEAQEFNTGTVILNSAKTNSVLVLAFTVFLIILA
ncbi:unnamed protein product [Caenorhabditis bovis]|uniref:Uncharacterized protein n=1 Tax=Caenorhabditis bovis TaxID=2654633 RepID=A0A8S1EJH1_9PELO|nr:unnamed protein product [Caenorhabditis bovis]